MIGGLAQAVLQPVQRAEIELAITPLQHADLVEGVVLEPLDHVALELRDLTGYAERAIVHVAAGPSGDLAELGRGQVAVVLAVEFTDAGERDMVEVEIETHADRVGGDEEVDIAVLVERDLGVAGARAERAEHDGRAASLTTHQLGDGIDVVDGE